MLIFLLILTILASIVLILIIIAQNPKGGGLSSSFGGSMTSNIMGVRQTTDFLEKATWYLAIGIIVVVMLSNFMLPSGQKQKSNESLMKEQIEDMPTPLPPQNQNLQNQPGQQNSQGNQQPKDNNGTKEKQQKN